MAGGVIVVPSQQSGNDQGIAALNAALRLIDMARDDKANAFEQQMQKDTMELQKAEHEALKGYRETQLRQGNRGLDLEAERNQLGQDQLGLGQDQLTYQKKRDVTDFDLRAKQQDILRMQNSLMAHEATYKKIVDVAEGIKTAMANPELDPERLSAAIAEVRNVFQAQVRAGLAPLESDTEEMQQKKTLDAAQADLILWLAGLGAPHEPGSASRSLEDNTYRGNLMAKSNTAVAGGYVAATDAIAAQAGFNKVTDEVNEQGGPGEAQAGPSLATAVYNLRGRESVEDDRARRALAANDAGISPAQVLAANEAGMTENQMAQRQAAYERARPAYKWLEQPTNNDRVEKAVGYYTSIASLDAMDETQRVTFIEKEQRRQQVYRAYMSGLARQKVTPELHDEWLDMLSGIRDEYIQNNLAVYDNDYPNVKERDEAMNKDLEVIMRELYR